MSRIPTWSGGLGIATVLAACNATPALSSATAGAADEIDTSTLRPGEVAELPVVGGVASATLLSDAPDAKYVVIMASTKFDTSGTELAWSVDTQTPVPGAATSPKLAAGCSLTSDVWRSVVVPQETPPTGEAVAVGTTKTMHAFTTNASGFEDIQVKAIAVGAHSVVWADITPAHPAALDDAFVTQFIGDFENTILPRERSVFGVESDVDGDGHIQLVFTPLTYQTAVAFFEGCDLANWNGCPATNGGEYLWLTPPNAIDPPYNTPSAIKEILTHETSHLIHFNRKVLRNQLTSWPDSGYMDEGVGGFAQDAIGPQAGNLYVAWAGLDDIADFSLGDTLVDGAQYDDARDGALRGGSYLFVRWLYDRAGGDTALASGAIEGRGGPALVRALLDAPKSVAATLPQAVGSTLEDLGADFYTALAMSNRNEAPSGGVAPTNACFSYLPVQTDPITGKPRGADLFAQFHGMQMTGVAMSEQPSGTVRAGGAAYYAVAPASAGAPLPLTIKVDAAAAPRVRIGRIH